MRVFLMCLSLVFPFLVGVAFDLFAARQDHDLGGIFSAEPERIAWARTALLGAAAVSGLLASGLNEELKGAEASGRKRVMPFPYNSVTFPEAALRNMDPGLESWRP